jgi:hypothetical protein
MKYEELGQNSRYTHSHAHVGTFCFQKRFFFFIEPLVDLANIPRIGGNHRLEIFLDEIYSFILKVASI